MKNSIWVICFAFLISACHQGETTVAQHQANKQPKSMVVAKSRFLQLAGTYRTGKFDESAAEVVTHIPDSNLLVFTSASENALVFLDISNPEKPEMVRKVTFEKIPDAGGINSVAAYSGILAAAVENKHKQAPGFVVFLDTEGEIVKYMQVGALPDMVTFSPDGRYILVANEGEPDHSYQNDPVGSVSLIEWKGTIAELSEENISTLTFGDVALEGPVRISGPNADQSTDLEPEYIAVSADSKFAFVTLQENNAIAKIDLENKKIIFIKSLGFSDHSQKGFAFDASKKDGGVHIKNWPVKGMPMPDGIAAFDVDGKTYLITANEGDGREYGDYKDETKVKKIKLDPVQFPNAKWLQKEENIGGLVISSVDGDTDKDGDFDVLYSFGTRSFSIWDADLNLVYDSGQIFEQVIQEDVGKRYFNTSNDKNKSESRSPKKGPEPEGVTIGKVGEKQFAFILLERIGGIMVFDVTNPSEAQFYDYQNNRNFEADPKSAEAGDLGPETAVFISKEKSTVGKALLAVANEVSGTVSIYYVGMN